MNNNQPCKIQLAANHRQGQFNDREGVVEGVNRDGTIMVRFPSGSIWGFRPSEVIIFGGSGARRTISGHDGYTVEWRSKGVETVGTVFHGNDEQVGQVFVTRQWNVTVGRDREFAPSVSAAIKYLVQRHQKSLRATSFAAAAFGVVTG